MRGLHMKHTNIFSRGFTMIELLVVIAIIGILAAVMYPLIGNMLSLGGEADAQDDLRVLGRAALTYKSEHEGYYPAAGGYFTTWRRSANEQMYGRAIGWVNFQHDCKTYCSSDGKDLVGDGSVEDSLYGIGGIDGFSDTIINEEGVCLCFDAGSADCGINPQPAGWADPSAEDGLSLPQAAIRSGAIFELTGSDLGVYVNSNFAEVAVEKGHAKDEEHVVRAYAMNVIMGTDEDVYDTGYEHYGKTNGGVGGKNYAVRWGARELYPREKGDEKNSENEAEPSRTILFVELDLDELGGSSDVKGGDQVWDWDQGNESIGFNFEDGGQKYGYVCFADGSVKRINDPSSDSKNPDKNRRQKLAKYYGSGGICADGEKLD